MKKAIALAALVSATTGLAEGWTPRASAFQAKQTEERKRLGLDSVKAAKQYPTPEVRFGPAAAGSGASSWLCPGKPNLIVLEGKLAPGTLVGTRTEGVEIVKDEFTPKGWQGTFNVKPGTRGPARIEFIAPVSGITSTLDVVIGCPVEWVIDLKNGEKLTLKVLAGESYVPGEWSKGGKVVDSHSFELSSDGKTFMLNQKQTAEDRERSKKAEATFKEKSSTDRQSELAQKMQECATLPTAQMGPCMQKYSAELQQLMGGTQAALKDVAAAAAPKVGCMQLQGTIEGKKLKGNGNTCAGAQNFAQMPFTGEIR
jgi:hypothetical protein